MSPEYEGLRFGVERDFSRNSRNTHFMTNHIEGDFAGEVFQCIVTVFLFSRLNWFPAVLSPLIKFGAPQEVSI